MQRAALDTPCHETNSRAPGFALKAEADRAVVPQRAPHVRLVTPSVSGRDSFADAEAALHEIERLEKRLGPDWPLLAEGQRVELGLVDIQVGRLSECKLKWFAVFTITEPAPYVGLPLFRAWNAPLPGRRLNMRHKLFDDYSRLTGLRPPPIPRTRPERFLELFLRGVRIEAVTRQVRHSMDPIARRWVEKPPGSWYSLIDRLESVTAGVCFVCRGRRGP